MYDPRLGRFLSPDPYVQVPGYSQSYNRYSYVWNNPLKYTDPDGYQVYDPNYGMVNHNGYHMPFWQISGYEHALRANNTYFSAGALQMIYGGSSVSQLNNYRSIGGGFYENDFGDILSATTLAGRLSEITGLPYIVNSHGEVGHYKPRYASYNHSFFYEGNWHSTRGRRYIAGYEWAGVGAATTRGGRSWYSIYNWPALGSSARTMDALFAGDYLSATGHFLTCAAEVLTLGYATKIHLSGSATWQATKGGTPFVQFSSKTGISKGGQRVFSFQVRFPNPNLNIRIDRGFRAPFKNTTSSYFGNQYNGFNTHINIQKPGSFNYHLPLNPLKWKYYNIP